MKGYLEEDGNQFTSVSTVAWQEGEILNTAIGIKISYKELPDTVEMLE